MQKLQIGIAILLGIGRLLYHNLFLIALPFGVIVIPLILFVVIIITGAKVGIIAKSLVTVCFVLACITINKNR